MDLSQALQEVDVHEPEELGGSENLRLSASQRAMFDALYRRHRNDVMRLLRRRVGNEQDAADLMQEAYLRILRYRHCGPDSLRYLLVRTAINLAASHHAAAHSRLPHVPVDGLEIAADASPWMRRSGANSS